MQVCRSHGGNTRQARAKAEERLLAAQDDLMAALLKIALNEKFRVRDRLIAIRDALNRADLNKGKVRVEVDTPWARLGDGINVSISRDAIEWDDDDTDAIEPGASRPELPAADPVDVDQLNWNALGHANRQHEDAESYLHDLDEHDIVRGHVVNPDGSPGVSGSAPPPWERGR